MSQTFHAYAHMHPKNIPFIIKQLQRMNLILSRNEHNKHHLNGIYNYSIVNGWSNPLLNIMYKHIIRPFMNKFPEYYTLEDLHLFSLKTPIL
jgi:hypothetical protein